MVAIFTGAGLGSARSGSVLGQAGLRWSSALGRGTDEVFLNAATDTLLISDQDEYPTGLEPDVSVARTYNSFGDMSDENGDNWRFSSDRWVYGFCGTLNTSGSTNHRVAADGSDVIYSWNGSAYVAKEGAGPLDTLAYNGSDRGVDERHKPGERNLYGRTGAQGDNVVIYPPAFHDSSIKEFLRLFDSKLPDNLPQEVVEYMTALGLFSLSMDSSRVSTNDGRSSRFGCRAITPLSIPSWQKRFDRESGGVRSSARGNAHLTSAGHFAFFRAAKWPTCSKCSVTDSPLANRPQSNRTGQNRWT